MHPVEFPGSFVIGKPKDMTDEECASVYAATFKDDRTGFPYFRMKYLPSLEDLNALNRGEGLYIDILALDFDKLFEILRPIGLRPHSCFTLNEHGEINQ